MVMLPEASIVTGFSKAIRQSVRRAAADASKSEMTTHANSARAKPKAAASAAAAARLPVFDKNKRGNGLTEEEEEAADDRKAVSQLDAFDKKLGNGAVY